MAKRAKTLTDADKKQMRLSRAMDGLTYCPEPTYGFEIGDGVTIGNLKDCVVTDILADGKVYEIDYTWTETNYGNPITSYHCRNYWYWHQIRPLHTREGKELIHNSDMQLTFSSRTISDGLLGAYYSFGVDLNPYYQREFVWSEDDDVNLIRSIFHNIDIGKFVFVSLPFAENSPTYEVLDGKQRMSALIRFYENQFSYEGLFYNDLSHYEQNHFDNFMISYAKLDENTTDEQKLRYFLMLNTSGKVMSEEHLNKVSKMLNGE